MQTGRIQRNLRANWIQRRTKEYFQIGLDKVEAKCICEVWRVEQPNRLEHYRLWIAVRRKPDEHDVSLLPHVASTFLINQFVLVSLQSRRSYNFTSAICHDSHRKKSNRKCTVSKAGWVNKKKFVVTRVSLPVRFYGFCIDVLERISKIIGFNYILDLVQDKKVSFHNSIFLNGNLLMENFSICKYGAKDAITGDWNGIYENILLWLAAYSYNFFLYSGMVGVLQKHVGVMSFY